MVAETTAYIDDPHGRLYGESNREEIGTLQVKAEIIDWFDPLQSVKSGVNVTSSTCLILTLKEVTADPPSLDKVHVICTLDPAIVVVGALGTFGF